MWVPDLPILTQKLWHGPFKSTNSQKHLIQTILLDLYSWSVRSTDRYEYFVSYNGQFTGQIGYNKMVIVECIMTIIQL